MVLVALACCERSAYPELAVDTQRARRSDSPGRSQPGLRISVAAMLSPQATYGAYTHLLERVGAAVGVDIELVQRRSYAEVNDLLERGAIDAAFLCTGGYLELAARHPDLVEVLAVPVVGGELHYRSLVIVAADSAARSLADLAGQRLALTDELSLTGYRYPLHALATVGQPTGTSLALALLTRSHDRSIEAVESGLVAAAAVDSLVYAGVTARDPTRAARTRIIHASPPFGMPPLVVRTAIDAAQRERLRSVVLAIERDPLAVAHLRALGIDRFAIAPDGLYDSARALVVVDR